MAGSRLTYLFEKYIRRECDKSEQEELFALMANIHNENEVNDLVANAWDGFIQGAPVFTPAESAGLLKKIEASRQETPVKNIANGKKATWWRLAAAAAIIATIGTAVYLLASKKAGFEKPSSANMARRFKNDLKPGGNKATLRLANGSTILLDSAGNGALAQQGNVQVTKLSNGELVYTINGKPSGEVLYNTMTTPRGGQYQLTLPDDTKVWLNAASSITYPTVFAGSERKVAITGEAYFEVMPVMLPQGRMKMPFKVTVNNSAEVEVLGTHFNINAYTDAPVIKTTLLEGSVKVSTRSNSGLLKPGQQAQCTTSGEVIVRPNADLEETMAWKNGMFMFKGNGIKEIMNEVARWYDADISYQGNISDLFVVPVARDVSLSKLLMIMEQTDRVHFTIEGKKVVVIGE